MKIKINGKLYECNSALEHITLLKKISDEIDRLKKNNDVTLVISKKSVTVGGSYIKDDSSKEDLEKPTNVIALDNVKHKLSDTLPKGVYQVSSFKREDDVDPDYDMALAHSRIDGEEILSKPIQKKISRKIPNYDAYNELKKQREGIPLVDYDVLTKEEVADLKNNLLVFISGTLNHKVETGFYDNCELLKNISTAAFITGKAVSPEKILKEALKLTKLSRCTNTDIICYEANNNQLRGFSDDKLFKAFDAMVGLSEILSGEGYKSLLCLDGDIRERLRKIEPNYKVNVPIISRVSSKEIDGLSPYDDFVVMDSKNAYDELLLTNNTKRYIKDSKTIKIPSK